ncbi:hypothetical protein [Delftia sp. PS-11]|uniref:hypothetical protein n=1 Tax=Delftia sp. PS-11 TaxID=2767222 RepID=UPI0024554AA8|nr:hypothetical protein [Delftia sp. PS-11]KAJ8743712.1 hypothetical protein H9T68_16070 [Delftia sp. PS-11]
MGIEYQKKRAKLSGFVSVEEAEGLLQWLQSAPQGALDMRDCEHLHAANLQVLMAVKPKVAAWPKDAQLDRWLRQALETTTD